MQAPGHAVSRPTPKTTKARPGRAVRCASGHGGASEGKTAATTQTPALNARAVTESTDGALLILLL
jgi:hypothetical protein